MTSSPTRVLFFAEGATLAHVGRPLVLARSLQTQGYEVVFCRPATYEWITRGESFEVLELRCQAPDEFARRLDQGQPLYDLNTLSSYVEEDRELIRQVRPDLIVGDFRLSLSVSARLEGIPYATICDAYWSPEAPLKPILPALPVTRFAPVPIAQAVFSLIAPIVFRLHAAPMEALHRAHGLPGLNHDLRRCYTDADLRLFANPQALFPDVRTHPGAAFLGPVAWSPTAMLPDDFPEGKDLVYVSMGSSGKLNVLSGLFKALSRFGNPVVVTTAGRKIPPFPKDSRIRLYDFLPGPATIARARLVICNGGSPTTNQALVAGTPLLGIPTNMDQFLNMRAIESYGAGLSVRADRATAVSLGDALETLLGRPNHAERAAFLACSIKGVDPALAFATHLSALRA